MVRLQLDSIAQEAMDLNLAKEGYTAFYVDGTNGLDTYPGDSWEQPFKTIQHAVDEAESWSKIFVKSGTYLEKVTLNTPMIEIAGEDKSSTIITSLADSAIYGTADYLSIRNITAKVNSNLMKSIHLYGNYGTVMDCIVDAGAALVDTDGCYIYGDHCIVDHVDATSNLIRGINIQGSFAEVSNCTCESEVGIAAYGDHADVHNCYCDGIDYGILIRASYCNIHNNDIFNCAIIGAKAFTTTTSGSIVHNNFIGNVEQVHDVDGVNSFFENFYDDHTTDTNNDGLCDTPYTFTNGTDYQPVSRRNGWKQESLGTTSSGAITIENIFSIVNALLTLTETGGTITTDGTEQNVYINNAPAGVFDPKMIQIDLTNHTATETVVLREYYRIKSGGGLIKKDERTFVGVQDPLLKNVTLEPNRFGVQVTIEKTAGTNRGYDFEAVYRI